jgi:hypothetical protein
MADRQSSRASATPDEDLDPHRLFCRHAIRLGADMTAANELWRQMRARYPHADGKELLSALEDHFATLSAEFGPAHSRPDRKAVSTSSDDTVQPSQPGSRSAGNTFSHVEVFPLIARLIVRAPTDASGFVDHDTLVAALLSDGEAGPIVARASTSSSLRDVRAVASNMVAWFSQQITVGSSPWSEFFYREKRGRAWAYRPRAAVDHPLIDKSDVSAVEGDPRMFFHLRRERDPALAEAKRNAVRTVIGRLECEACGFATDAAFPGLSGEVCEIHHRVPLSEACSGVETRLEDLAVLCANCHRAIHRTRPVMSVEQFRSRYFPAKAVPRGAG